MILRNPILPSQWRRSQSLRSAFTLIELMVSLAIALALILGVNQIFAISSATVGAGQALGTISRDDRTAHSIMYPDVRNIYLGPTPGIILNSSRVWAFRSRSDAAKSTTGTPVNVGSNIALSDTSHRIDTIGFFASGDLYRRQTSGGTGFTASQTSTEAWIWYGHLALPNNATVKTPATNAFFIPGDQSAGNDNNKYASEFILGRMAMLLVPNPTGTDVYVGANPVGSSATASPGGPISVGTGSDGLPILFARYDEAQMSITSFLATPALTTVAARDAMTYRFAANPFPQKPLTNAAMAGVAPVFIRSCSQFVVEYAGDYVTQDNVPTSPTYGDVLVATPDFATPGKPSVVDFVVDKSAGANPALWTSKTRWYGFPRSVTGNAVAGFHDVIPLRDVRATAPIPPMPALASFERTAPASYAAPGDNEHYICSWGPDTATNDPPPKLLRITMALDDPNGRIADAQIFEYVIDVQ